MKIAYICEPQLGGTYTFFREMRPALGALGIDFRCVPPVPAAQIARSRFAAEEGLDPCDLADGDAAATRRLVAHLAAGGYDLVMSLPCCGILSANLVRYVPAAIRTAMRVPMMTRGAYAPTRAVAGWCDVVFAVSDRVADDLCDGYGLPRPLVHAIFNGVDVEAIRPAPPAPPRDIFTMLYAGRLSDLDKGILLLPGALVRLRGLPRPFRLLVAGQGPDRPALERDLAAAGVAGQVEFLGGLPLAEVRTRLGEVDCFVLPSRFEGCPNALMEAMAAGCACVAAGIRGSVDRILRHEQDGLLFRVGDADDLGRQLQRLAEDDALRRRLAAAGRARVENAFSIQRTAERYAGVFRAILAGPAIRRPPLPLERYEIPRALQPTWRTWVPAPLKRWARTWLERRGKSA